MNISFLELPSPFPKLKIDHTQTELEIFRSNFRAINPESIIKSIENKSELKKSVNISSVLRLIGNDHFKEREYPLAFHFYFKSISLAPVDSVEYALALGNRSAAHFATKNYKECLKDIDLILKTNYPEEKLYKIYIRQTECLLKLEQNYDAVKSWAHATGLCDKFNQFSKIRQIDIIQKRIVNVVRKSKIANKDLKEEQYPNPELKNGENVNFLNASNSVELKCNNAKGRHVVAKIDIEQGDVLFAEEAYSAVLLNDPNLHYIYCSNCFIFTPASIPCKNCSVHFYCSDNCREAAWLKSHQWECYGDRKQLFTNNIRLILNVMFEASRNNFSNVVEDESRFGNKDNNFAFVDKLVTNKNKIMHSEIYIFTKYAIYLVIYLKQFTDYFIWLHDQPAFADKPISDLYELVGGILLKLSMQIYCNSDDIIDIDLFNHESPEVNTENIGCGLYVASAMINHSCDPNTLVSFDRKFKIVRAIKKIEKNTEITINYEKYYNENKEISFNRYKFKCNCLKCSNRRRPKDELYPWLCMKCKGKAFIVNNERYALCNNPNCKHVIEMKDYRAMEFVLGPNLLAACVTSDYIIVENTFNVMKKMYHKENIKFVGYFLAAYQLYFENRDLKKCVKVSKAFVKFTEQFHEIHEFKVLAYLRLTTSLTIFYTVLKINKAPINDTLLYELHASLNETKKLLEFYVPKAVLMQYEKRVKLFLSEFNQEPALP